MATSRTFRVLAKLVSGSKKLTSLESSVGSIAITSPELSANWVAGTWTSFFDNISSPVVMLGVDCCVPSKTEIWVDGEFSSSVVSGPPAGGYGVEREWEHNTERGIEGELEVKIDGEIEDMAGLPVAEVIALNH